MRELGMPLDPRTVLIEKRCREPSSTVPQRVLRDFREHIRETVSAFANTNAAGGLLVLGISKTGELCGVGHLTDAQRNMLADIGQLLGHQSAAVRMEECADGAGLVRRILLIHVPETRDAICESVGSVPRAGRCAGAQNLPLTDRDRDQLRRDKQITDAFERTLYLL